MTQKPRSLEEAYTLIYDIYVKENGIDNVKKLKTQEFLVQEHMWLGRWIRNNWGLWSKEGELHMYFNNLGISHPDDMSSIILEYFHTKLTGASFDIEEKVNYFKDYWNNES